MYHWYKLLTRDENNKLICDEHDRWRRDPARSADSQIKRKWFILGLTEAIPIMAGMIVSAFYHLYFPGDVLLAGSAVSLMIIAMLRNKTPQPPIGLRGRI